MDIELIEIRDFLADYPPFSELDAAALDDLPRRMAVRYLRRGSDFPPADECQASLYILRKGAVEQRDAAGALLAKLGEGDVFDAPCFESAPAGRSVAVEDSLLYLLPCAELQALRRQHSRFDEYFGRDVSRRLRQARAALAPADDARVSLTRLSVAEFARRAPVTAPPSMTIRDAAGLMTRQRVSALLIVEGGELAGIVTDRDLRSRCLAADLDPGSAVAQIMTRNVHRIAPEAAAFEALMSMTQAGIHHLPVADAAGVRGLVSATDLMRWQSANPVYLAGAVRRCDTLDALMHASAELPELLLRLVAEGASGGQAGQALSTVGDAVTCRLIELGERRLGPPPVPFAWLCGGSQGRHEQALHSDQDSALILHDSYRADAHGAWFDDFARLVCDGLDACGFRYCPGQVMAANPQWRRPISDWIETGRDWIRTSDNKAAMLAANLLDMRSVWGDAELSRALQGALLAAAARQQAFLARMVANALSNRPPLGFFRNLVLIADGEHAHTLDIKRRGLIPITDMARIHALAIGAPQLGTVARLRAAAGSPGLSASGAADLEEAFEYLGGLRMRHQAQQVRRGEALDNYLAPDGLGALERRQLKEAFAGIAAMQSALSQAYPHHSQG